MNRTTIRTLELITLNTPNRLSFFGQLKDAIIVSTADQSVAIL